MRERFILFYLGYVLLGNYAEVDLLWGICRDIGVRTRDWIGGGWVGLSAG